ncbi:D-alanine--D-alanine ligase [Thalassobacter stenotrophicus]|uniref:D-alanine--D-alanine ligase n=1 Tax=Thalassobacter stenotrophicus TaxID=266809 RepID=UPI0022A9F13E|nr:D-alanine--D-alanine ligase [Thalassobacter stenotrophicus]UYP69459.1 D-alanine--D-alanine ligase [Thalassobacter stenotrophicus]
MSSRAPQVIALLQGGQSSEREVSLSSGQGCAEALRAEGFTVHQIDAGPTLVDDLKAAAPDVVFNALHGQWGEDGCVQGLLEWLRLPYTHSGVLASALAMDKTRTKDVYRAAGLPVVRSMITRSDAVRAGHVMDVPYVVKPNRDGSSVGIYLVMDANSPAPEWDADMPEFVMVEAYVPGRELTTSVMGDRALGVTEIVTNGWYDYAAKYEAGGSSHVVPANIPPEIAAACEAYALRAHAALGCRGVTRTDFRWDDTKGLDGLILLETNTQPGMTPTSLTPEQAQTAGISFGELCRWIVEDASCAR